MMRPPRMVLLLALALAAPVGGCKTVNSLKTKAPDPGTNEGEWARIRDGATRRALLYDRFQERAILTVTYLSPPVREARAHRLGEWLGWTEQELASRLASEAAESARYDDFLVALFTPDRRANDLDAKQSIWRLAVRLDDGDELVTRDATNQEVNATLQSLFPYVSPFDVVYRVRFNRAPGAPLSGRRFTLEVASGLGKMELAFGDGAVGPDRPEGSLIP